jgi:5-formyltetrahydrofolate cyclo-ligase
MDEPSEVAAAKRGLRRDALDRRAARDPTELAAAAARLAHQGRSLWSPGSIVAAYAEIRGEPPLADLRADMRAAGVTVLLPVPVRDGHRLDWAVDLGTTLPAADLGVPVPAGGRVGETAHLLADVIIVPALAADRRGRRLGRGGGFYDRALPRLDRNRTAVVACVFDDEVIEEIPAEPHDIAVDAILTPSGLSRCPGG